jgi:DNA-binding transcriptional regulator PaaX
MAIAKKLNLAEPEAASLAERVLSYFGFTNVIIDNVLDPADRKLFYKLHDEGLLHSYAESLTLVNGKTWRIFYWEISDKELRDILRKKSKKADSTYSSLPAEYWPRPNANT